MGSMEKWRVVVTLQRFSGKMAACKVLHKARLIVGFTKKL